MENTNYHVNIGKRATSVNCSQTILLLFITFDSQLLYKIGLLIAFSLSMLGKCFRATISMFSSVQRLSSSSTSLEKEKNIMTTNLCSGRTQSLHVAVLPTQCFYSAVTIHKSVKLKWRKAVQLLNIKHAFSFLMKAGKEWGKFILHCFFKFHSPPSHVSYLSWKRRNASWAQILIRPSTGKVSSGLNASNIPLTHRVISRGE